MGYNWRTERAWEMQAWLASHVINISGKSVRTPVTPRKLLRRQPTAAEQARWWERMEAARKKRALEAAQTKEAT